MASTLSHKTSILPILESILRYFSTTKVSFRIFPSYRCHNLKIFEKLSPGIGPQCSEVIQFIDPGMLLNMNKIDRSRIDKVFLLNFSDPRKRYMQVYQRICDSFFVMNDFNISINSSILSLCGRGK